MGVTMPVKKVLIVGGGIGGLSAAIALQKVGIQTEIVELNKEWNVYGVGIIQASNQLRELGALGVAEKCLNQGRAFPGWRFYDANGNIRAEVPTPICEGYPANNGISRKLLHHILLEEAIECGTKIRMGTTISSLIDQEDKVIVECTDGTTGEYDLVIGADGIRSKVRKMIFGEGIQPEYIGQAGWRYPMKAPEGLEWGGLFYGEQVKAGIVPMSPETIYLFCVSPEVYHERKPADKLHELMQDRLKEFGGVVAELREQIVDPEKVVYRPYESLLLESSWFKGRVLLIGDAVHSSPPQLGQGAALAIEDAVVLGELLKTHSGTIPELLEEFMDQRIGRCKIVVETSINLVEWEKLAWVGQLDPSINPSAAFGQALKKMAEPLPKNDSATSTKIR